MTKHPKTEPRPGSTPGAPRQLVAVEAKDGRQAQALALAQRLGLPMQMPADSYPFILIVGADGLSLQSPQRRQELRIDYLAGPFGYRLRHATRRSEPLARAVGLSGGQRPSVLDATAGLGQDGVLLAALGCRVILLERSPIVAALLEDALRRATPARAWMSDRLVLRTTEAARFMLNPDTPPTDVVYLDPMYPSRDKSALPAKEMQMLRELVGDDTDARDALQTALHFARRRVVVKRPKAAEPIGGLGANFRIEMPNTRFDIYLPSAGQSGRRG